MRRKSRLSSTLVHDRTLEQPLAAVTTVRVKIVGETSESCAAAKRRFAKTQSFVGVLPRFDAVLPSLDDVAAAAAGLSAARSPAHEEPALGGGSRALHESAERRKPAPESDEHVAVGAQDEEGHSTTLRVRAVKPSRARQLWQRQTPLIAFAVAASLCVLCMLAVNLLAP